MMLPSVRYAGVLFRIRPYRLALSAQQARRRSSSSASRTKDLFWQKLSSWKNFSSEQFNALAFQQAAAVFDKKALYEFFSAELPDTVPPPDYDLTKRHWNRDEVITDVASVLRKTPMKIRITPYVLSLINWENPLNDPIFRQFIPTKSALIPDHAKLKRDSLDEREDAPVPGLVHRYPGKVLFLSTNMCPLFCMSCTRSYMVGPGAIEKEPQSPDPKRWELMFRHIERDETLQDVVVSGGDTYTLSPRSLMLIGERLLNIPHIRRIRLASKGFVAAPGRLTNPEDKWTRALIDLSNAARKNMKQLCLHTHINHSQEITWVTEEAANMLYREGVTIRNQSVLLRGINDTIEAQLKLMHDLIRLNITPYYVYQCDMVPGVEHMRTPLSTALTIDKALRGTTSGFMTPNFVIDLPGGGGKRLASTYEDYDEGTGVSTWRAPGLGGKKGDTLYYYYDPAPLTTRGSMHGRI